eukprot:scaffold1002_cov110-Skeletonema_menzelii.AAC.5
MVARRNITSAVGQSQSWEKSHHKQNSINNANRETETAEGAYSEPAQHDHDKCSTIPVIHFLDLCHEVGCVSPSEKESLKMLDERKYAVKTVAEEVISYGQIGESMWQWKRNSML